MSGIDERKAEANLGLAPTAILPPALDRSHRTVVVPARKGTAVRGRLLRTRTVVADASSVATRVVFGGGMLKTFLLFVVLPTIAVGIYVAFFASRQYMAETRFVVRGSTEKNPTASGGLGGLASMISSSNQDSYILSEYIRSSEMTDRLQGKYDLGAMFGSPSIDAWARLDTSRGREDLLDYWRNMVRVTVENMSGIIVVKVWAFAPKDALALTGEVLKASEELANRMTQRGRDDTMRFARMEVARAEDRVRDTLQRLKSAKDATGIVDTTKQVESALSLLTELNKAKIDIDVRLQSVSKSLRADSPIMRELVTKKQSTEAQIAELEARLTSADGASTTPGQRPVVSQALKELEQLEVEKMFSEKAYETSQIALDAARRRADAQQVYVTVFSPPTLPEEAFYPRRLGTTFAAFFCCLVVWSIATLLSAAIRDHRL